MARLGDLNKQPPPPTGSEPPAFHRKAGQPFFTAPGLGHTPLPAEDPQATGREGDVEGAGSHSSRVTRAQRLKGGIPANRLAEAMVKVAAQPQTGKRELLGEVSRGARLDLNTWDDVEKLAGGQRKMPAWAREALRFVAGQSVSAEALISEAESVRRRREEDGGRGRTLVVALGSTGKFTAETLAKRTGLAEQAVLEACVSLFHKAHLVAMEEGAGGEDGAQGPQGQGL